MIGSCFIFNCYRGEESGYGLHKSCVPPTVGSHVTVALPAPGGHSRVEDYWGEFNIASIVQEVTSEWRTIQGEILLH